MLKLIAKVLLLIVLLGPVSALAIDGTVLINRAAGMAAAGFPHRISQPGSYRLTSNLVAPAETDGIPVMVTGVSLDLNGLSIIGPISGDHNAVCSPAPVTLSHALFLA